MPSSLRVGLVSTLACAALLGPGGVVVAHAATTEIAEVHNLTAVRAWNGVQAWTDYDTTDRRWHVVVRSAGQVSIPPAIPAGRGWLKVDVGPGPDGKAMLAFIRCAHTCHVVVSDLDGQRQRTVPGSDGASSPTIWGSRVAWVRGRATVLVSRVGVLRPTRLSGIPRRRCYRPFKAPRLCERPSRGTVDDLELGGSRLALIDSYGLSHGTEGGTTEVRLESVAGGPQRLVAAMNVGEGQQTWIGPSWARGDLFFYRSCPFGCAKVQGAYRYTPETRTYAHAQAQVSVSGFALDDDGRHAFETLGLVPGDPDDAAGEIATSVRLSEPLTFTRSRAPIAEPGV